MTEADVIQHWLEGAKHELRSAQLLQDGGEFAAALFHCHLAIEKALKALYMQQYRRGPPLTHDLSQIAGLLERAWTDDEYQLLADLTQYAVAARYDDPAWAEREATPENTAQWIARVDALLFSLIP